MIVTDAQVHVWEAHRPGRPWPAEGLANPAFVAVPGARPHRAEPIGAQEMVAMMDAAGVGRAVIVPPSPVGDRNDTALEAAARYPGRFVVMGRFDPTASGARAALRTWLAQPHMAGIRMTFHRPQWSRWLDDGTIDWFWADCERLGIPLMLLIPGRLDAVERIARRHPGLQLVVDHLGRRSDLRDEACFADLDVMLGLGALHNVSIKASAAPCYSTEDYPFRNLKPYLKRIYEHFGPRRMFWGSDVSRLPCSYRQAVDHFLEELDFIPREELPWVMGRGLSRLLRWEEPDVRSETPADAAAVEQVVRDAFAGASHTSGTEQFIVRDLRMAGALTVSLVAAIDRKVVGYLAVSPVSISDGSADWYGLGPVAVLPDQQGLGTGSMLVHEALRRLRQQGAAGCVVLGEPAYYGRFGFRAEPGLRLQGLPPEYFQALSLRGTSALGSVRYHSAFGAGA